MKKKAVFLDRDGTINIEKKYLYKIKDFEFLPGAIKGLQMLQDSGFLLIIVTNQSGIGRGYYTENDFIVLNTWMIGELASEGVDIKKVYYCPHFPDASVEKYRKICNCRKPALGMYEKAMEDFEINIEESFVIGDRIRDCAVCEKYGCSGFLVAGNERPDIIEKVKLGQYSRIQYADDLLACARQIVYGREA